MISPRKMSWWSRDRVTVRVRVRVRVRVSSDLAAEDELLVEMDLDEARAAEGVDAALVVVPQAHLGRAVGGGRGGRGGG